MYFRHNRMFDFSYHIGDYLESFVLLVITLNFISIKIRFYINSNSSNNSFINHQN